MLYRAFHDIFSPLLGFFSLCHAKLNKHRFPAKWIRLSCHHTRMVSLSIKFSLPDGDCCTRALSIDEIDEITFDLTPHYTSDFILTCNDARSINFLDDQFTVLLRNLLFHKSFHLLECVTHNCLSAGTFVMELAVIPNRNKS